MGRAPCCDKTKVKRGPWSPEEDAKLKLFIEKHGTGGNWIALPTKAGLKRCGKSCRLRWLNYLRPNIKHGEFSDAEDRIICSLYATIGSKWSIIAAQLPGRTDNDIKNYWNTKLKKKLMGISTSKRRSHKKPQQQEYHHQPHLFLPSLLTPNTPISSMSTAHYPCSKPLSTGLEDLFSISQGFLNNITTTVTTTTPMKQPQYHTRESEVSSTSNLLMFGGESCCISSDGNSNRINLSKEMDYGFVDDDVYGQPMWMVDLFDKHGLDGVDSGVFGEASTFDLGIEDFEHLITSTSNSFFPFG